MQLHNRPSHSPYPPYTSNNSTHQYHFYLTDIPPAPKISGTICITKNAPHHIAIAAISTLHTLLRIALKSHRIDLVMIRLTESRIPSTTRTLNQDHRIFRPLRFCQSSLILQVSHLQETTIVRLLMSICVRWQCARSLFTKYGLISSTSIHRMTDLKIVRTVPRLWYSWCYPYLTHFKPFWKLKHSGISYSHCPGHCVSYAKCLCTN